MICVEGVFEVFPADELSLHVVTYVSLNVRRIEMPLDEEMNRAQEVAGEGDFKLLTFRIAPAVVVTAEEIGRRLPEGILVKKAWPGRLRTLYVPSEQKLDVHHHSFLC